MAKGRVLTLNGGSSSIRFALYETGHELRRRLHGKIDRIGESESELTFEDRAGDSADNLRLEASSHRSAVAFLIDWLAKRCDLDALAAIGHRVVHGMARNTAQEGVISTDASSTTVRVIHTDEELMIVRSVCRVLGLDETTKETET